MKEQYHLSMVIKDPSVYCLRLPGNSGAHENCYVLMENGEMLIVDPPIYKPKNIEMFHQAIRELVIDIRKVSVYFTHIHGELSRMNPEIMKDTEHIYFMEEEYQDYISHNNRNYKISRFRREGYPENEIRKVFPIKRKRHISVEDKFTLLADQDEFRFADHIMRCFHTPGPTCGHSCLYMADRKILFSGTILPKSGYPAPDVWKGRTSALEYMIDSLDRLRNLEIDKILPAMGEPFCQIDSRVEDIIGYYSMRLLQVYQLVRDYPGENAYELSLRSGNARTNAEKISARNRWRLMKDTLACLIQLRLDKYVSTQRIEKCVSNYPGTASLSDSVINNL